MTNNNCFVCSQIPTKGWRGPIGEVPCSIVLSQCSIELCCVFCPLFKFHFTQQKWQIWKPPDLYFSWHSMCFSVKKQSCDMAIKCHNHFSWPWTKHTFFHFCDQNTHCSEENSPGSEAKTVRHCSSFSFFQTHCRDGPWSENWNGIFLHNIDFYIPFTLYLWTYWEMYCCTSWIPAQSNYHLLNSKGFRF